MGGVNHPAKTSMTHANAPLTQEGRQRLVTRVLAGGRPIAHVAAEAGVAAPHSRNGWPAIGPEGADGLEDPLQRTSSPPSTSPLEMLELIDRWRRDHKWSARRIHHELARLGHHCCLRTVSRWLKRLGIGRRRDLDPTGESNRTVGTITTRFPGHMLHMDVKKVGRSLTGAAGGHTAAAAAKHWQSKRAHGTACSYTYLHSAIDGYSRLAYTEALEDETAPTTIGFFARARAYFTAHGITRLIRVVTDDGANYRASRFVTAGEIARLASSAHAGVTPRRATGRSGTLPATPAEECLYARVYDSEQARRKAIGV